MHIITQIKEGNYVESPEVAIRYPHQSRGNLNNNATTFYNLLSLFAQATYKVEPQGLSAERIQKFEHFTADQSLVGEQCLICMEDLKVGTQMVRLDCHVDHILCKKCVGKWFKNKKTLLINHYVVNFLFFFKFAGWATPNIFTNIASMV